ncbi:MAG TPA: putative Ig domain-containing protein, partial [Jatrophihabitans sp.]|nr:putative Ig domain-containing protein [Jatrophihabitans sp.]
TATIAGTPSAAGSFPITITASNGVAPDATQAFTLTVNQAPDITSADHTTFTVGTAGSFTVTTSPAADTVAETGTLPSGVTFTDNGNGTATLAGTPAAGTGGVYALSLKATNATGFTTQNFTLMVYELASFTSADHTTFVVGTAGSFTVTTTAGYPVATTITKTGTLPSGVSFTDNGDGTATLAGTPAAGTDGSYPLTISATNAAGNRQQSFTLTVVPANASPVITSADHATFAFGTAGSFTVTTTAGYPVATTITKTGSLPGGVSFTDNGDGTATIAGTPTAAGAFPITITASNGASTDATQSFMLTVTKKPAITSGNSATFVIGTAGSFTVTTTAGYPVATTITETGTLPSGVSFTDNGDGTATLAGTPAAGTDGSYPLTITASNSAGSTLQSFTLTVVPANSSPVITSADHATFTKGSAGSFTVTTTAGYPTATTITKTGTLPAGVTFTDNHNGTATIAGTPTVAGAFTITITASNGASTNATQTFTLTVNAPPTITSANTVTFISDVAGQTFTVTTTAGYPTATTLTETGALPAGVTFTDNHNGTATIAGTPSVTASTNYSIVITASNGIAPNATQNFTLKVTKVAAVALPAKAPKPAGKLGGVPPKIYVNQVITVTGTGYKPGAPIEIGWYYSSSGKVMKLTVLAHGFANAAGNFSIPLTVANNTGSKTVMSAGLGSDGKARYLGAETVVNPPLGTSTGTTAPIVGTSTGGGGLADTGLRSDQRASAASAGALALTGFALMLFGRRRRRDDK